MLICLGISVVTDVGHILYCLLQSESMPPVYKLTYFHGRGRGEVSRIMFAQAAVEYVDDRIELSAWPALKPSTHQIINILTPR